MGNRTLAQLTATRFISPASVSALHKSCDTIQTSNSQSVRAARLRQTIAPKSMPTRARSRWPFVSFCSQLLEQIPAVMSLYSRPLANPFAPRTIDVNPHNKQRTAIWRLCVAMERAAAKPHKMWAHHTSAVVIRFIWIRPVTISSPPLSFCVLGVRAAYWRAVHVLALFMPNKNTARATNHRL